MASRGTGLTVHKDCFADRRSAVGRACARSTGWFAGGLVLALSAAVQAQDYKQVAPKTPKSAAPELVLPLPSPATPSLSVKGNPQLLPELIGLRLVDDPGKVSRNGVKLYGITVDSDNTVLDRTGLRDRLARFLDRPLYADDLQAISR